MMLRLSPPGRPYGVGVSQTPTYDQLRDERINADVPASEADLAPHTHLGRHHFRRTGRLRRGVRLFTRIGS
jgi:hypothetical protein